MFIKEVVLPMSKQLRADGLPDDAHRFLLAGVNTVVGTLQGPAHNGYNNDILKMVEVAPTEKLLRQSGSNKVGLSRPGCMHGVHLLGSTNMACSAWQPTKDHYSYSVTVGTPQDWPCMTRWHLYTS
jgi:hypothetical protein